MAKLYKRGKHYWVTYEDNGKRIRKSLKTANKQFAEAYVGELSAKIIRKNLNLESKDRDLKQFVQEYIEYCRLNHSRRTYEKDCDVINRLLVPFLEKHKIAKISQINTILIEKYKAHRLEEIQEVSVNREIDIIKAMLNRAVEWNYLHENPVKRVKKLPVKKRAIRYLSKEEIDKLLKAVDEKWKPIIYTFLYTGLRKQELQFLRWEDIDLDKRQITIQNQDIFHTKNYKPRIIDINDKLYEVLKGLKKNGTYVFGVKNDKPFLSNFDRGFRQQRKKVGLNDVSPHILRHTFASHLIMSGVPLATVKELMGHQDIRTTMIYAHIGETHKREAVQRLNFI